MTEESTPKRRGRPYAGGPTTKRNVRIGETWTRGEALAKQLGITMTAYVEEALRRENARVGRAAARERSLDTGEPTDPGSPVQADG